jgi:hypothetical protein
MGKMAIFSLTAREDFKKGDIGYRWIRRLFVVDVPCWFDPVLFVLSEHRPVIVVDEVPY